MLLNRKAVILIFIMNISFSWMASAQSPDISALQSRLQTVGVIRSTAQPQASIVVLRDTETNKTILVQVGRPFIIDQQVFFLQEVSRHGVIISTGHQRLLLQLTHGREERKDFRNSLSSPITTYEPEEDEEEQITAFSQTPTSSNEQENTFKFQDKKPLEKARAAQNIKNKN